MSSTAPLKSPPPTEQPRGAGGAHIVLPSSARQTVPAMHAGAGDAFGSHGRSQIRPALVSPHT
jgi:hypothetical protein